MFIHEYGINKIRQMVRFELGKEIEKDAFLSCHERGKEKNFEVPMGNRRSDLQCSTSEPQRLTFTNMTTLI